jgi:hypothetical protein
VKASDLVAFCPCSYAPEEITEPEVRIASVAANVTSITVLETVVSVVGAGHLLDSSGNAAALSLPR